MTLKLIGAHASPFVRKVRVFLAEKGLAYEHDPLIPFNVPPEFKKISPLGKIPALVHDGRPLADSSVICAYLERIQPQPALYPSDPYDHARALWFEEWHDGGLVSQCSGIFFERFVKKVIMKQEPDEKAVQEIITQRLPGFFGYLEGELGDRDWLVGSRFSIADVAAASMFVNFAHVGVRPDAARWPKLAGWLERVWSRPSYKACIEEEKKIFGL
jgi:glutathione S-transferase